MIFCPSPTFEIGGWPLCIVPLSSVPARRAGERDERLMLGGGVWGHASGILLKIHLFSGI